MKTYTILGCLLLVCGGCINATVSDKSVCDSQSLSFPSPTLPAIPPAYSNIDAGVCSDFSVSVPSESTSVSVDLSSAISSLNNVVKSLSVNVTDLTIDNSNGEFDWVSGVTVQISGNDLPMATLATYTMPDGGASSELSPKIVMDSATIYNYLSSGKVTLTLTLQGQTVTACQALKVAADVADGGLSSNVNLCVSGSGNFSKSL
jgi:hypothetical protein